MTNSQLGNQPAYACAADGSHQPGLTKREAFAMAAMQGILAKGSVSPSTHKTYAELVAQDSLTIADALLVELGKETPPATQTQDKV